MSNLSVIFIIITLFISLILPPAFLIVYALRNKKQGIWSAWLLGALGFFVPQILIRLPLLTRLSQSAGFAAFAQNHPVPLRPFSLQALPTSAMWYSW